MASVVNFTVEDFSPTVSYYPRGDTFSAPNLSAGWNPYWQDPGFSGATTGSTGSGTSLHITSLDGASLQIQWKGTPSNSFTYFMVSNCLSIPAGTGITLFGNATRSSYSITLDGEADASTLADPLNNVLVTLDNLADTNHTISLTVQTKETNPLFQFDKAVISAPPSPTNASKCVHLHHTTLRSRD
jgi:hypothetical protein